MGRIKDSLLHLAWMSAVFSASMSFLFGVSSIHILFLFLYVVLVLIESGISRIILIILCCSLGNIILNLGQYKIENVLFIIGYNTIILFSLAISEREFHNYQKLLLNLLYVVFAGQIVNLYFDRSIFGLVGGSIYADESVSFNDSFTRRGISFISSPQSLSLFYLVTTLVATRFKNNIALIISIIGAIMTGSKYSIFALILLIFGFLSGVVNFRRKMLLVSLLIMTVLFVGSLDFSSRIFSIRTLFQYEAVREYSAFVIWTEALNQIKLDIFHFLLGSYPFGFSSRIYQNSNGGLLFGSTESAFISFLLDGGLICIVLFISRIIWVARGQVLVIRVFVFFCIINMLFTPALYSSLTSLFVFPFLLNNRKH